MYRKETIFVDMLNSGMEEMKDPNYVLNSLSKIFFCLLIVFRAWF